jgi:hypothetical protein
MIRKYEKIMTDEKQKSVKFYRILVSMVLFSICVFITIYTMRKQITDRAIETENMVYDPKSNSYVWKSLELKYIFEGGK